MVMNKMIACIGLLFFTSLLYSQKLKPYTIGAYTTGEIQEVANRVESVLKNEGFSVLGSYRPVEDDARWVIVYSSPEILEAVKKIGGLTGFALAWRVAITDEGDQKIISYTTPEYWGNAYFREDFDQVSKLYDTYSSKIAKTLATCGSGGGETFGSQDGHDTDKLRNYRYMATMPKFDKTKKLNEFTSYEEAVATIEGNLAKGVMNLEKVFSIELKEQQIKLYGIGLSGENGETKFMEKIDVAEPKHTAFLPYEFLVIGNEVHMLHGRYRIALSFPDLKMGQFMKIVSTPPNIKKMMETATK